MLFRSGVRSRMVTYKIPEAMKGLPITLVAASIVSLAFFGFTGVVDGLLGIA